MSHWNNPYGNGGQEDSPYYPNPNLPQQFAPTKSHPTFLTLEEVEASQRRNQSQGQPQANTLNQIYYNHIDVSNSNLQATAQEFQPGLAASIGLASSNPDLAHTGAVRRNNYPPSRSKNKQNDNLPNDSDTPSLSSNGSNGPSARFKSTGQHRDKKKGPWSAQNNQSHGQGQGGGGGNRHAHNNYSNSNQPEWGAREYTNSNSTKFKNHQNRNSYYNNRDRDNRDTNTREREHWKGGNRDRPNDGYYERDRDRNQPRNHENWRQRSKPAKESQSKDKSTDLTKDVSSSKVSCKVDKDKGIEPKVESSGNLHTAKVKNFANPNNFKKKLDAASQRERLEQMVTHRMLECLVCCDKLRHTDKIWSCKQCYHILHLACTQRWAKSSKLENGWRCPACQNVLTDIPSEYRCYCDKFSEPKFEPGLLAHSCGEVCRRKGRNCEHSCTLLCHPGPCPDCSAMVQRACGCGRTKPTVKCNSNLQLTCDAICAKMLRCGAHTCEAKCHWGDCQECTFKVRQECHCGKQGRTVPCTPESNGVATYSCGDTCDKLLSCGNHKCTKGCHEGECDKCILDPQVVETCSCGKQTLETERTSCLDPIPCCDKVCNKKLNCGQPSQPHLCDAKCHTGPCPQCPLTTMVRCRCGHMDRELACKELTTKADDARCQKKCTKKRSCTRHKCNQFCCIEIEHECPLPCNHMLSCGLHRCELNCHKGRCPPCWRTSFQELYCECGASVIYPPVPCGTRSPECTKPCSRIRACGHEPMHNCHSGPCPQCTLFTTKKCHGGHQSRSTIPCHQEDFSCGLPCNKPMPCGQHRCVKVCHKGPCPTPCSQPCTSQRPNCEHNCNQPCHKPPCPTVPCKQTVVVQCECGLRSSTRACMDLFGEYQKIAMVHLASKMADIQRGQSVDITDIVNKQKRGGTHRTLECNDECRLVERNRRMAIGLQIRNPDLSAKLTPRYSDYIKQWCKKDARFCQHVHDKLTELVQLAKQSKQRSRSHSFECMNREKRHFVHEYCEHFGCESAAYDAEPNRNVVATAHKEKSWLPSCSIIELLQRENGQRKVPGPVINKPTMGRSIIPGVTNESVSLRVQQPRAVTVERRPVTPPGEFVDYFDNPPS